MNSTKYLEQIGELKLKEWLLKNYNLDIESVIPIPKGEIGDNYVIKDFNKQKYFLKIYLQSKLHIDNPDGLKSTLELIAQLHDFGIENIPYLVKLKNNALEGEFGIYSIVITSFVDGENPKITRDLTMKFAKIIAKIHQVSIKNINLPMEPFDATYANKLSEQLKTLEDNKKLSKHQKTLRELLLQSQSKLQEHLFQLNELCGKVIHLEKPLVVTHGDLIPDNLMIDKQGKIFIVDWDVAKLSPPERDVWFFMEEYGYEFIQTYRQFNQSQNLDIDLLSFYMHKRYIEDLVYWADQILVGNLDENQTLANLKGIKISCLETLKNIDEKVENIKNLIL